MKINKKLIEEKINNEIKDANEIVGYCIARTVVLPFSGFISPLVIILLAYLSSYSNLFFILFIVFIIYMIKTAIKAYKKHILVFLQNNIKALHIKGDNLDVVNTHTYSYGNVKNVDVLKLNKNLMITFTNDKKISYHSTILSTNSSFTLKDFDVKKFCAAKKETSN